MLQAQPIKKLLIGVLIASLFWAGFPPASFAYSPELFTTHFYTYTNSLKHYYRMEGNSNDSVGSNNGTDTTITYSTANGKFGQGAGFTANPSKINLTGLTGSNWTGAFTIVGWVKINTVQTTSIVEVVNAGNGNYWAYLQAGSAPNNFYAALFDGTNNPVTQGTTVYTTGMWYQVALVRDTGAGKLRLYVNGAADATASTDNTTPPAAANLTAVDIGWRSNNGDHLTGNLDDVAFFTRVLSASEISQLYTQTRIGPGVTR
jgi:hypothetical protein